jgi:hypothetical protein
MTGQPEQPLGELLREVLDLIDETVARIPIPPLCPRCASPPLPLSIGVCLCPNLDCAVFAWDPALTAEQFEAAATTIDITRTEQPQ